MPELAEFLEPFRVQFRQAKSAAVLERYLTGLLTEHPNKNCVTLAEVLPGTNSQTLNHLVSEMVWDEDALNAQRIGVMLSMKTEGDAALVFDDTGFAKQGRHSVGVQRQYSGTLGKVANCQVTVNCHLAERTLAWPVATRLYLPESWTSDPQRRAKAHVPEEVVFKTKPEIALDLLDEAKRRGVRWRCVVSDADYGDNPVFLNGLEERGEWCVVAVRCDFSVSTDARATERADTVLEAIARRAWKTISWSEGARGTLRAKFAAVRCWRVDGDGTRHLGWLIGQRPARGQSNEEWKYYWSSFPAWTELPKMVEYTHRRHWIEQFHEEAKQLLGWDQFQGRRWDGFHRHAVTVMLAYSFLVWLEWRTRDERRARGRPRTALSPSARSSTPLAGERASRHRRLARRRSDRRVDPLRPHRSLPLHADLTK